ncbi:glycosyltransferase family 4 protein [Dermabacteraceae bacterium TAE3-ERU5]|nr:glycosyltransferase family 4 protein [Dermabacteraceae bacterium TAE3-ERU5]
MIAIAANNGDIGGGEVMQISIARALSGVGKEVCIVGPENPAGLIAFAREEGFETVSLPGRGRKSYMLSLLKWRLKNLDLPLWCNGLVPSAATSGLGERIVHLHRIPEGLQKGAEIAAKFNSLAVLVPSYYMKSVLGEGTRVLENWTGNIPFSFRDYDFATKDEICVGFLGRATRDKGLHVLARAVYILNHSGQYNDRRYRLIVGGESRFESRRDERIVEEELERVAEFTTRLGWVSREALFVQSDLAVFPSSFNEPFGLVAAEAMAYGIPFVVSTAGGLPEVAGEDHPWIFARDDAEELADVIYRLAESDPSSSVKASRRRWEIKYSPAAGRDRVNALLGSFGGVL